MQFCDFEVPIRRRFYVGDMQGYDIRVLSIIDAREQITLADSKGEGG